MWLARVLVFFDGGELGDDPPAVSVSEFAGIGGREWWAAHAHRLLESGVTRGCSGPPLRFCGD